ncbi:hypothetical protein [Pinibacter soli]|uniref:Uncharacterized protein n=1 Tax=Pinibacter soli TaxID=3044211 RepID=A0ABT6RFG4_9BACT|nr:hypothetical protein [Pinibacter soli]MDI3321297.1 hypothetical protein [Pinibacter soli]
MTTISKTRIDICLAGTILFVFLFCFSFICAFAKDEGTLGDGAIANFLAEKITYLFPFLLIEDCFAEHTFISFFILASANVLAYSTIVTLLFTKSLTNFKIYKPFNATYYLIMTLLFSILARFIYLIAMSK